MNINEGLSWILKRGVRKDRYGLDKIEYILEELDNPQNDYVSVLIGGTNGKGSVTAICEAILCQCEEYNVGTLTSPHLLDMRERIKINGVPLENRVWVEGINNLRQIFKVMDKEPSLGAPSFFETIASLGFWAYRETFCDIVFLEVGLGGRFDATNACQPEISVITNIGTDHQEYLGTGKIAITREKLGIARKKRPLITSEKSPEILNEIEDICRSKKANLALSSFDKHFSIISSSPDGHKIRLNNCDKEIEFGFPGHHQLDNLGLAIDVIKKLRENGFAISDDQIQAGIESARWPGRLQWINNEPPVLLDGAHNAEGVDALVNYLTEFPPKQPLNIIFGAMKDKPLAEMADKLSQLGHRLCYVPPSSSRALKEEDYKSYLGENAERWLWFTKFSDAVEYCTKEASTLLVSGSLYLISDALKYFSQDV